VSTVRLAAVFVDDEKIVLDALKEQLRGALPASIEIETALSGADALEIVAELIEEGVGVAVMVCDHLMPRINGDELLCLVHDLSPDTVKIMLTGQADLTAIGRAVNGANLYRYLTKPWQAADLEMTVRAALRSFEQGRELVLRNRELEELNAVLEQRVAKRTRALESALQSNRAILDNMGDGLVALDETGAIELANPAFLRLYDLAEMPVGRTLDQVGAVGLSALVCASTETGEVQRSEVDLPARRIGAAAVSTIRSPATQALLGTVVIVRDVTFANEVAQMKTDFTAMVTHELRTPMTSVLGFARLTRNRLDRIVRHVPADDRRATRAAAQSRANLDIIISEGERLTALINNVLDIAKMEGGHFEWSLHSCQAPEIVHRAVDATASLFGGSPVQLVKQIEEDLPEILADQDRLIQVVINLISNAQKFTAEGQVVVGARAQEHGVLFRVSDTGSGIPRDQCEKVFEKFKQVGGGQPGGSGLGLPICREIVSGHQGRIWVESELGRGSSFLFWIPAAGGSGG
jgi:signal transduction histidine kinase/FixJ family two-component response regulator